LDKLTDAINNALTKNDYDSYSKLESLIANNKGTGSGENKE
jgi:hypothetical protein